MTLLSRENIAPRVLTIISNELGVKTSEIQEDDSICSDLGADSLDIIDLAMVCEDEFRVEIYNDDAEIETVGQLIDLIMSQNPTAEVSHA